MDRTQRILLAGLMTAAMLLAPASATAQLPPVPVAPDSDSDTEGHETPNPGGDDHAEATGWQISSDEFEGEDIRLAYTRAEMDEDGHNRADASALRIGPEEPATAHTDSREGPGSDSALSPGFNCDLGFVCFGALYATAESTEGGDTDRSTARSGILNICLFPEVERESLSCENALGFMTSESEVERDNETGETHSRATTTPAALCFVGPDQQVDSSEVLICGSIASRSSSHSNGNQDGSTSRSSLWEGELFVQILGEEIVGEDGEYSESESFHMFFEDPPESFEDAQGCPDPPVANGGCGFTNQGESFEFPGGAASRQEALHIVGWEDDGSVFFELHAGVAQTLARFQDDVLPFTTTRNPGVLASTGMGVLTLLALAVGLMLAGAVTRRIA